MNYFGKFRLEITNKETGRYTDTGYIKNVFLDKFFSRYNASSLSFSAVVVFGSGSSQPLRTDTNLQSPIPSAAISADNTQYNRKTFTNNVFKFEKKLTFEGTKGKVQGNVSELGLSFNGTDSQLFTRALIKDENGNPTTISLGANDIIKLTYIVGFTVDLTSPLLDTQIIDVGGVSTTVELFAAGYNGMPSNINNYWKPKDWYSGREPLFWGSLSSSSDTYVLEILKGTITDYSNWTLSPETTSIESKWRNAKSFNADGTYVNTNFTDKLLNSDIANGDWDYITCSERWGDAVNNPNYYPAFVLKFTPAITKALGEEITISGLKLRCGSK